MKDLLQELDELLTSLEDTYGDDNITKARQITNKLMAYSFSPEALKKSYYSYADSIYGSQHTERCYIAIEKAYLSGIEATLKRFGL